LENDRFSLKDDWFCFDHDHIFLKSDRFSSGNDRFCLKYNRSPGISDHFSFLSDRFCLENDRFYRIAQSAFKNAFVFSQRTHPALCILL